MIDKIRLDQLTREMGWIRGLARALVSNDVEDLAQDAWLVAADELPADRPTRPWLARMTRNLARMRGRATSRRERREAASEPPAGDATPDELVERVELQRMVAGEVLALAEPYRSTILLHYFEGKTSVEIARKLGISDGTVRWRLKQGLDEIRERLRDRDDAPKGGWLKALAPFAGMRRTKPVATASSGSIAAIIGAAALVVFGVAWELRGDTATDTTPVVASITRVYPAVGARDRGAPAPRLDPLALAQPNASARRIAGTVMAGGAPIAGATVRLGLVVGVGGRWDWRPFAQLIASATTDERGHFDFGTRPPAEQMVTAMAPGHTPVMQLVAVANPTSAVDRVELELGDCTRWMTGHVRDAAGTVIVGARVTPLELATVETSSTGEFSTCIPEQRRIRVGADGYGSIEFDVVGTGEMRREIVLAPEMNARGRVVDEADHPIHGARVIAGPAGSDSFAAPTWGATDDKGWFEIPGLVAGRISLIAAAVGFGTSSAEITALPDVPARDARIVLVRGARVHGHLRREGTPIPGVTISATMPFRASGAVTQLDGSFVLDGVPIGTRALQSTPVRTRVSAFIVDRSDVEVDVEARPGVDIHGHVRRHGAPATGVTVTCRGLAPVTAVTDVDGAYTCRDVQADYDSAQVSSDCPHSPAIALHPQTAPALPHELDIDLPECREPPEIPIHGTVVDRRGAAVPNVEVRFGNASALTDGSGTFDGMATVGSTVSLHRSRSTHLGYPLREVPPPIDASRDPAMAMRLVLDVEPRVLRGRVVDPNGAPIADVHVSMHCDHGSPDASAYDAASWTMSAVDGRFAISNVLAMSAGCTVIASVGDRWATATWLGDDVAIVLGPGHTVRGDIQDYDVTPVVTARSIDGSKRLVADIDDDFFEFHDVDPGLYVVTATVGSKREVQTLCLGCLNRTIRMAGPGDASADDHAFDRVVEVDTGRPVAGMACQSGNLIEHPDEAISITDADGRFWYHRWIGGQCWSSRGPFVPVRVGGEPVLVSLTRPGTARPGFVVAPSSSRPTVAVVDSGGAAAGAGLHVDDAIVELDGAGVAQLSPQELMYLVWTHPRGTLRLAVDRDGSRRDISIPIRE